MQRTSKTAHLGTAFFLCLGLAVVPVSLRFAGVPLTLSPRLAAAMDVWGQITEAFGGGYQRGAQSELAAVKCPEGEPSNAADDAQDRIETACAREAIPAPAILPAANDGHPQRTSIARRACPKATERRAIERSLAVIDSGALAIHAGAIEAAFKAGADSLQGLDSLKQAAVQKEWLSSIESQFRLRRVESKRRFKTLEIPQSLRVLIQIKSPAASSKAAECKVRAAIESVRRVELQRAALLRDQSANPDNCEF
ncbi:MAG TPA: hypothetical protein VLM38_19065 [Blastocatellia bacterium]|nr:hypothetical protein [Blastocatellia bacterium]